MTIFDQICDIVLGTEAGFTENPQDSGNWTGGKILAGELKGTKYGISAAQYPSLDIASLTIDVARDIYRHDYWDRIGGDNLPPAVALAAFDAAVNSGVTRSAKWLQAAVGAFEDGNIGPQTIASIRATVARRGADALVAELMAQRLLFNASLPTWKTFGLGWARRICRLPMQAATITA
jgi:lysozyme family protein